MGLGFMINKKVGSVGKYKIGMSKHAAQRCEERNVDVYKVVGCILSFGIDKLREYEEKKCDILIKDLQGGFSVIFAVHCDRITLITVIHKLDCYVKDSSNTVVFEV